MSEFIILIFVGVAMALAYVLSVVGGICFGAGIPVSDFIYALDGIALTWVEWSFIFSMGVVLLSVVLYLKREYAGVQSR